MAAIEVDRGADKQPLPLGEDPDQKMGQPTEVAISSAENQPWPSRRPALSANLSIAKLRKSG
jgi:hypothetical protein